MYETNSNWIHFIGVGGVSTAPLAKELSNNGYRVTGSDTLLYEPVKSYLGNAGFKVFDEYRYSNLVDRDKVPGLVVAGSGISLKNRELLFAQKQKISIVNFPHVLNKMVIDKESIVVSGTYAKTTTSAALVHIFESAGVNISYMFGGFPINKREPIKLKSYDTLYSIVEGDEYITSRSNIESKFYHYDPKYLVITSVKWDHTDIFQTEDEYVGAFRGLIKKVPKDGKIIANIGDKNIRSILKYANCDVIQYDPNMLNKWASENKIETAVIGDFNKLNTVLAAFIADVFGIIMPKVREATKGYLGVKRRLEIKYKSVQDRVVIIDDFASSPPKVETSITTIKKEFPNNKLFVIYEPNLGNRTEQSLSQFKNVFNKCDELILPKFTEIKSYTYTTDEKVLADYVKSQKKDVSYFENDKDMCMYMKDKIDTNEKVTLAFLSSHGMEERIRYTIKYIEESNEQEEKTT